MRHVRSGIHYLLIILFISLGFIGLALPIVPQSIFFLVALIILSFEFPKIGNFIESKMNNNSYLYKVYHKHKTGFEKYFK